MHPDSRRKLQPRDPECYHLTMSTEEHITQLTAQIAALQAQLACHSQSPPPPQPSAAPPPPPKPPKVSTPSPFSGVQDNLDCFKAKCSLYLSMRQSEFPDECCKRTKRALWAHLLSIPWTERREGGKDSLSARSSLLNLLLKALLVLSFVFVDPKTHWSLPQMPLGTARHKAQKGGIFSSFACATLLYMWYL